jgi:hypothetical protein
MPPATDPALSSDAGNDADELGKKVYRARSVVVSILHSCSFECLFRRSFT